MNSMVQITILVLTFLSKNQINAQERPLKPLFPVVINDDVLQGKISGVNKGRPFIKKIDFPSSIKKYEVFIALNKEKNGAIAELVVRKILKNKKIAITKALRTADGFDIDRLEGLTIIRLQDLKKVVGNFSIFRENPVIHLGVSRTSGLMPTANVISGVNINPVVIGLYNYLEVFPPALRGLPWLNWVGFRGSFGSISPTTLDIRQARSNISQTAKLTSASTHAEIVFQPWFDLPFLHRVACVFGFLNQVDEQIVFSANELVEETVEVNISRSYTTLGFELGFNPVPNLYAGYSLRTAGEHSFSVDDSSFAEITTGNWSTTTSTLYGQITQEIKWGIRANIRVALDNKKDTITNATEIGSGDDYEITDWVTKLELGVVWHP